MRISLSSFLKGMGAGVSVGMAVLATGEYICEHNKCAKKKIGHAMKSVSEIMENVSYMLK